MKLFVCNETNIIKYKIKNEIKESYTWEEAENVIKAIITPYVEDPRVTHNSNEVCIFESNKVHKRYDRQKACMIIARTVDEEGKAVTSREYDNMSAEWFAHNLAGKILPLPSITKHTDDVNLELNKDSRGIVRFASKVMEILGAE